MTERYRSSPETIEARRILEGKEREQFAEELGGYIEGLEAALQDPDLFDDERVELEIQLEGLKDSQDAIQQGGEIRV